MLVIFEGVDHSGKSTLVRLLHGMQQGSVIIKKQYNENLYPIDFGLASEYDWQAILDRIVLANPNLTFIADRSFFTQTVYQLCLGHGIYAITNSQLQMYNNYCKVISSIPHVIVYCQSPKFELDNMITSIEIRRRLTDIYKQCLHDTGLNVLALNTAELSMQEQLMTIIKAIEDAKN